MQNNLENRWLYLVLSKIVLITGIKTPCHNLLPASLSSDISRRTLLYSALCIPTILGQLMNRVSAPVTPCLLIYCLWIYHLQVLLQSRSILATNCIFKLAASQPPSVIPNSLNHGLHVRTIMVSKCIPKLT